MEATKQRAPAETVRCRAVLPDGRLCNTGLWRPIADDLLEVSHALRNGRRLTLVLPIAAAQQTLIQCHECGTRWWAADVHRPRLLNSEQAALAVVAQRPPAESASLIGHNSVAHASEAA